MKNTLRQEGKLYKLIKSWLPDDKKLTTPCRVYVSSDGDFIVDEHVRWSSVNNSYSKMKRRLLKKSMRGNYLRVSIRDRSESCHRLVAKAWVSGYFDNAQVNHKNGDKTDNRAENLEWVTASQNQLHVSETLKKRIGEKNHNATHKLSQAKEVKKMLGDGVRACEICKRLGVNKYFVSDIKRGKTWRHA